MEKAFADWFRKTREKKGLTQLQAAQELALSGPTVSRWEGGTEPRSGHLLRISKWGSIKAEKLLKMLALSA